jgi:hypothetical protein
MSEDRTEDRFAERFREAYRATPSPGPAPIARVEAALRAAPRPRAGARGPRAWFEPRRVTYRPLAAAAAGLALIAAGALAGIWLGRGFVPASPRDPSAAPATPAGAEEIRFVLGTASASSVAVVGDFNGWDASATPMRRDPRSELWTATVRLAPGWHSYVFVVDGERWVPDPQAPLAPADDFGMRRSVIVVGERDA